MPNGFDHLLNDLLDSGEVTKSWEQHFAFTFTNGAYVSWNIDRVRKALSEMAPADVARITRSLPHSEVSSIVEESVEVMSKIDREYAMSLPDGKASVPIYAIEVPGDIGAPRQRVGQLIVIDGNHRLFAAREAGRGVRCIFVPSSIERSCRDSEALSSLIKVNTK